MINRTKVASKPRCFWSSRIAVVCLEQRYKLEEHESSILSDNACNPFIMDSHSDLFSGLYHRFERSSQVLSAHLLTQQDHKRTDLWSYFQIRPSSLKSHTACSFQSHPECPFPHSYLSRCNILKSTQGNTFQQHWMCSFQ
jgi:hypothetical protein